MIEVKNLYKSFEGKEVLKNINAVFENGKTNLIIGQTGTDSGRGSLRWQKFRQDDEEGKGVDAS